MNGPTQQSKVLFDLDSSTRITLTTVVSLMLSHLVRNVALSRPISLLDIKDDDNSGGRAAMSSKQATAAGQRAATHRLTLRGAEDGKSQKTKSSKWDLSHLH